MPLDAFVTPACVTAVDLKGTPQDTFLELGIGQKYLSRGFVPAVLVVTAGLTVKIGPHCHNPASRGGPRAWD